MTWSQTRQKMYESFFLPVNETADLRSNSSRQAVRTGVLPPFTKTQSSMNHVAPTTSFSCHTLPESYSKVNLNFRHKHSDFTALSQDAAQTCWGTLFNKWKVKQTIKDLNLTLPSPAHKLLPKAQLHSRERCPC